MSPHRLATAAALPLLWLLVGCDQEPARPERPRERAESPATVAGRPGQRRPVAAVLPSPKPAAGPQVALGDFHSCAVAAGRVSCRGSNVYRQLGVKKAPSGRGAVVVPGVDRAVRVAAGAKHSCALVEDGSVWCWGLDQFGQTGHDGREPAPVAGAEHSVALALGAEHSCALLRDGTVRCWGSHGEGQLGSAPPPTGGRRRAGRRDPLESLLGPRNDEPRRVAIIDGIVQIAAGDRHTCARTEAGTVWCWGANDEGQLGLGVTGEPVAEPRAVPAVMSAVHVAAGGKQSCAALADGTVRCWGSYEGSFVVPREPHPWPLPIVELSDVAQVDVGATLGCASTESGRLSCWKEGPVSDGSWYELGHPPEPIEGVPEATRLAVGLTAICATRPDDEVVCWGRNPYGMVSSGDAKRLHEPTPYGSDGGDAAVDGGAPSAHGGRDSASRP